MMILTACGRQGDVPSPAIQAAVAPPATANTVNATDPATDSTTDPGFTPPPDLSGYTINPPPSEQIPDNGSRISPCRNGNIVHQC